MLFHTGPATYERRNHTLHTYYMHLFAETDARVYIYIHTLIVF